MGPDMPALAGVSRKALPRAAVLLLLSAIYAVNYVDRQVLAIVLQDIKREFLVSDTMLGLLLGPAFALFYATLGVPIALAADRASRSRIVTVSLACFSLMTLVCGLAARFWQLLAARMLTGIGEAGTGPASQSIISDLYPLHERAGAQSIYGAGTNVGLMVAFFLGGWIADRFGWRAAFFAAGAPGLALTLVALVCLKDPPRSVARLARQSASHATPMVFLLKQRSYPLIVLGTSMSAFAGYGITAFVPAFLIRSHELTTTEVGLALALIVGVGGSAGSLAAGRIADRIIRRRGAKAALYVPAIAAIISAPFWLPFLLARDVTLAIVAAAVPLSLTSTFIGPCISTIQTIVPPDLRARASAMQLFIGNLIGLGLGPFLIGALSDALRSVSGENSLRYAMIAGVLASLMSAPLYLLAARRVPDDLRRLAALEELENG